MSPDYRNLPAGPVIKNLPSSPGDTDLTPGLGIPQAAQQLILCGNEACALAVQERVCAPQLRPDVAK